MTFDSARSGRSLRQWQVLAACLALSACATPVASTSGAVTSAAVTSDAAATARVPAALTCDPSHPARPQGWVRTELYFGLGPADDPVAGVTAAQWREFLDGDVSTRFPDGLSVLDVYGQWRDRGAAAPERLRSKLVVILHEDTAARRADLDAIRQAYKRRTGDQSVLRVTQPADVSF